MKDLDDLAFDLGLQGYFGASLQLMAKRITEARFLRDYPAPVKCFQGARRTYSNVIGMFVVLVVMVTIFSILAIDQDQGTYSIEYITAEFGDEVLPFLGLFNGCYRAKKQGPTLNRRLVYEQIGSEDLGGKFAYCNEIENGSGDKSEGWVFFKGISADFSCEDYILRSGSTNTFDIIDATSSQWYTKDGQLVDYLQVSELQVSELPAKFSSPFECGPRMFLSMIGSCDRVDTPVGFDSPLNGTRSKLFEKLYVTDTDAGGSLDRCNKIASNLPWQFIVRDDSFHRSQVGACNGRSNNCWRSGTIGIPKRVKMESSCRYRLLLQ